MRLTTSTVARIVMLADLQEEEAMKLVYVLLILLLAFIPAYVFLGAHHFLQPEGFVQNFILRGVTAWLLDGLQVTIFIIGVLCIFAVVTAE